jgi:hypothetical protein
MDFFWVFVGGIVTLIGLYIIKKTTPNDEHH